MGKKLAVLVGCNYPKTQFKLYGCINDVVSMKDLLERRFGFDQSNVQLLTDVPALGSSALPTGANIKAALKDMVNQAGDGDTLFFHFSGHGTLIPALEPGQPFKQDEAIVPCDLNLITDEDFRELVNQVPKGASFTILSDSCHSGALIDKEKEQIGPSNERTKPSVNHRARGVSIQSINHCLQSVTTVIHGATEVVQGVQSLATGITEGIGSIFSGIFRRDVSLKFRPKPGVNTLNDDQGILLSGCQVNETSADADPSKTTRENAHGAFTNAVLQVLEKTHVELTNKELVEEVRSVLKEQGFDQHPCLYCSDSNTTAPFLQGRPKASRNLVRI
ncbi:hypothetical protein PTKIN_Ptkin16aG0023600 [Pterospermum kingtungense]